MNEFEKHLRDGKSFRRLAPSAAVPIVDTETGRATFIFNTEEVGRDGHIVYNRGIRAENFQANPTILFAHDDKQPPVGRATALRIGEPASKVDIEFTPRDMYPFGATVGDLVRGGYLNACSMSWLPIKWKFSTDRNRPGGVDFEEVDLLEISIVPVPALPDAIATARANGIDTGPLYAWAERLLDTGGMTLVPRNELETLRRAAKMPKRSSDSADWKVGAAKDLPIEDSDSWDGSDAEKSIFEYAGGDEFDSAKARKGFLVYNAAEPDKRGSYKLPIAHAVDGELKVPKGAIRAAASRISQTDIPSAVMKRAQAVLTAYEKRAGIGDDDDDDQKERALKAKHARALARAPKVPVFKRGLYEVAQLCYMLEQLGYCHASSEYEAALEGDNSEVPGMLGEALIQFGEALKAMADEEIGELLEAHDGGEETEVETRSLPEGEVAFVRSGATPRARAWRAGIAIARAGKSLSASNKEKLEDAQEHHSRALKSHREMGEHHEALGNHLDAAQDDHERATQTLSELGEHLRTACANPAQSADHLERAVKSHGEIEKHMGAVAESHQSADDSHEDVGDSHNAVGRRIKGAQRCVRGVLSGAVTSEADETGADAVKDKEAAQAEKARAARAARAREITERAKTNREPITLD